MAPKKGFVAPYIRFPWNRYKNLIGKDANIYQVSDSQFIVTIGNVFTLQELEKSNDSSLNETFDEKERLELKNNGINPSKSQNTQENVRARGLVGYDVALTRRRSPVRIRPGPSFLNMVPDGWEGIIRLIKNGEEYLLFCVEPDKSDSVR